MPTYRERAQAAIEERANVWSQAEAILERAETENEDGTLTTEQRAEYDRHEARLDELEADIKRYEGADRRQREHETLRDAPFEVADPNGERTEETDTSERYREAFGAYLRAGDQRLDAEARALLEANFVDGTEERAQGTVPDDAGGYLVPPEFRATMVETMKAFGGLAAIADEITTATAAELPWPTNDDTSNKGEIVRENPASDIGEQDLSFGSRKLYAHIYTSKVIRVSLRLLRDSAFDLENFISRKSGERIGRAAAEHWIVGTGAQEPQGITVGLSVGHTTPGGQTTSLTYDDFLDLEHSVDPAYRNERSRWVFADGTLKLVRKLKDADQRPLWDPSTQVGVPSQFAGRPYSIDQDMPAVEADAKPVAFGDFQAAYITRMIEAFRMLRLEELYARRLQVGFLGFQEMDGAVQDPNAAKTLQMADS